MAKKPEMTHVAREMPRYRCHKIVHALLIDAIDGNTITPAEEGFAPFDVPDEYLAKHDPQAGGYYVVYADGYASWSPGDAFEDGYKPITGDEEQPERQKWSCLPIDEPALGIGHAAFDVCQEFDPKATVKAEYELPRVPEFRKAIAQRFVLKLSGGSKGIDAALGPIHTLGELVEWLTLRLIRAIAPPAAAVTGNLKTQLEEAIEYTSGYTIAGSRAIEARLKGKPVDNKVFDKALLILDSKSPQRAALVRDAVANDLTI